MEIETRDYLPLVILLFLILTLGFAIGILGKDRLDNIINNPQVENIPLSSNCDGLNLKNSAECLREEVREFFNYNLSNIGKEMSFEELKESGGVCSHYTNYYLKRIEELGFNSESLMIDTDNDSRHIFAVMSNEEGYCILDQTVIKCVELQQ